ncbi:MAG: sigma-70 family RNA polymerase sigma factor [Anaerolineae bacterium]|nr:sigma-70 family RNA polymerase sigma factor [Anaerolineae bacterium]
MTDAGEAAANRARLKQFIEAENEALLQTLHLYVVRAGLGAGGNPAQTTAAELMSDVVVEALSHADRFDPSRQPKAWLLGIAANLIKRRQAERRKHNRREPLARDLVDDGRDALSDDNLCDWLANLTREDQVTAAQPGGHPRPYQVIPG